VSDVGTRVSSLPFSVNWDYRCPFARNVHEHVVTALDAGADWDVSFVPFSLSQIHVDEGDPPVWDNPAKRPDLLAMECGVAVRDQMPELFRQVHLALFRARHDESRDLREEAVVRDVLDASGADADAVLSEVESGRPLEAFRRAHEDAVAGYAAFGVPTFVALGQAAFVRIMTRPDEDSKTSISLIDHVVDLVVNQPELNELKHTTIPR
jgi:DSBA-like thioredoxin domain